MNILEKQMINTLIDLRENYGAIGIKAEFEAEGTRMEEALRLKEITTRAGLDLTIKIGGCEAVKDMHDARTIGVNAIIAPMIESSYAVKKYINSTKMVFPKEEWNEIKFMINIETINGVKYIDDILNNEAANDLSGIVLGRTDLTGSMDMNKNEVDSEKIFYIANEIAEKTQKINKEFFIGGGVSVESLPFFKKLPTLTGYETRKVIFGTKGINNKNADTGIIKALEFELMWLKNKQEFYKTIYKEDENRFKVLESRYKKLTGETGCIYE